MDCRAVATGFAAGVAVGGALALSLTWRSSVSSSEQKELAPQSTAVPKAVERHGSRGIGQIAKLSKGKQASERANKTALVATCADDSSAFEFPPIGTIRSCFRECRGTPRQGSFAPSTRGYLQFEKRVPADSTDGLEKFSHVWIVFIFHNNTNLHHSKRAHRGGGSHSFRSKIKPPKLGGKSIGVFASRTPHRPNAIGITLAKIERISGRRIELSALDLLDKTPVLDIKPYVTPYDSVPTASIPSWCGALPPGAHSASHDLSAVVHFSPGLESVIGEAARQGHLRFYHNGADVCQTIRELLASDVRPEQAYRRWKDKDKGGRRTAIDGEPRTTPKRTCLFRFDMLLIGFVRNPEEGVVARVVEVVVEDEATDKSLRAGTKKRYTEHR